MPAWCAPWKSTWRGSGPPSVAAASRASAPATPAAPSTPAPAIRCRRLSPRGSATVRWPPRSAAGQQVLVRHQRSEQVVGLPGAVEVGLEVDQVGVREGFLLAGDLPGGHLVEQL